MPKLTLTSEQPSSDFQFESTIVIGRGGTADFVVPNPSVSRRHVMVTRDGDDWFVEDLGSGNGTFLNERILGQRSRLANGDQLRQSAWLYGHDLEADCRVTAILPACR